ncbi:MAG: hypothetical protein CMJ83_10365 [Planctomycetes bacterium]|nr:hypothetical protein [Planctomycetota bacterium]
MSQWPGHVILCSFGLAVAVAVAWVLRAVWSRRPRACYRLLVCVLMAALALPLVQMTVQGRGGHVAVPGLERFWWTESAADAEPPSIARHDADPTDSATSPATSRLAEKLAFDALTAAAASGEEPIARPRGRDWSDTRAAGLLALAWLIGAAFVAWRALSRVVTTRRLVRRSAPVTDPDVLSAWKSVVATSPLRGRIRLLASPDVRSPACWGLVRGVVIVPAESDRLPRGGALRCALLHELVHLERGDVRTALLQALLCSAFWFHPAAWWLARQLDTFRELSCDAEVVGRTGRRQSYARALIDCAERLLPAHGLPCPSLIQWSRNGTQLRRRIEMLVESRKAGHPLTRVVSMVGAVVVFCALWTGQVAIAATLFPGEQIPDESVISDEAIRVDPALLAAGRYRLAAGSTLDPALADRMGISVERPSAALAAQVGHRKSAILVVTQVVDGSPAARAGIRKFDVITHVDGTNPITVDTLRSRWNTNHGMRLTIVRSGRTMKLHLGRRRVAVDPKRRLTADGRFGEWRKRTTDLTRARRIIEEAIKKNDVSEDLHKALREARKLLDEGRAGAVRDWLLRGRLSESRGEFMKALEFYQRAAKQPVDESSGHGAEPWLGLGRMYHRMKRYDDARKAYEKAIRFYERLQKTDGWRENSSTEVDRTRRWLRELPDADSKQFEALRRFIERQRRVTPDRSAEEAFRALLDARRRETADEEIEEVPPEEEIEEEAVETEEVIPENKAAKKPAKGKVGPKSRKKQ